MLYVFVVAVLNLSLGVGVAVYLGRRYRALPIAGIAWDVGGLGERYVRTERDERSPRPKRNRRTLTQVPWSRQSGI